jgi:hypothetical protein
MAVSTTQSIWRSGGGDQTRQAYCGSGVMAATFYIAAAGSAGTVKVSSVANAPELILPAGAVITQIVINDIGTGQIDLGYQAIDGSPSSANALLDNASCAAIGSFAPGASGAGTGLGSVMSATENVYITNAVGGTPGTGTVGGTILYYVTDPLSGQQSV